MKNAARFSHVMYILAGQDLNKIIVAWSNVSLFKCNKDNVSFYMMKKTIFLLLPILVVSCAEPQPELTPEDVAEIRLDAAKLEYSWRVRDTIKQSLRDEESVRWRNLVYMHYQNGNEVICGEYNAKNAYGAYVGFKKFIASKAAGVIWYRDTIGSEDFDSQWRVQRCSQELHDFDQRLLNIFD